MAGRFWSVFLRPILSWRQLSIISKIRRHIIRVGTFREEYLEFLNRFDIPYNPKYVFDAEDTSDT